MLSISIQIYIVNQQLCTFISAQNSCQNKLHKTKLMLNLNQLKENNYNAIVGRLDCQLDSVINRKTLQLQEVENYGNYVKADELKAQIEKLKKDLKLKKLHQLTLNHKREKKNLQQNHQNQLNQLHDLYTKKQLHFHSQKDQLKQQLLFKHEEQLLKAKETFQTQISNKMKQSSDCLNLRKIQQQMKKQKNYAQAHQIQLQVQQMEKKQKIMFEKQRQAKIQVALGIFKNKQKIQVEAFNKKIESGLKQLLKEKNKQIQKMKLKHINSMKDLISLQQKELLGQKGQIKSRALFSACRSREKFTSPRKC